MHFAKQDVPCHRLPVPAVSGETMRRSERLVLHRAPGRAVPARVSRHGQLVLRPRTDDARLVRDGQQRGEPMKRWRGGWWILAMLAFMLAVWLALQPRKASPASPVQPDDAALTGPELIRHGEYLATVGDHAVATSRAAVAPLPPQRPPVARDD